MILDPVKPPAAALLPILALVLAVQVVEAQKTVNVSIDHNQFWAAYQTCSLGDPYSGYYLGGDTADILAGAVGAGCAGGSEIVMLGFAVCGSGLGGIVVSTKGSSDSSGSLRSSGTKMTANATTTKAPIKRCFSWLSKS